MQTPVTIGITLGDPHGIGPEISLLAACRSRWPAGTRLVLIGSREVAEAAAGVLNLPALPSWDPKRPGPPARRVSLWDPAPGLVRRWEPGKLRAAAGRAAATWIEAAVQTCLQGRLNAMVTAPIHKLGFKRGGIDAPGHTELLAGLTRTRRFGMMLIGGPLRVFLVTRHLPLREVPRAIDRPSVLDAIRMTSEALPWLGVSPARIAVCGLNPHAGDGGAIGQEDLEIIRPAIRTARRQGIDAEGPLPADTVFYQARNGHYDAVVAMYHDQGLAPLKMLAFDRGVNITLGLPLIRTSPDHGTAYALAGTGQARPESMRQAIRTARELAGRPLPWAVSHA